ncbi:uncharacterized protein LOC144743300 [Ciona intestinalis]
MSYNHVQCFVESGTVCVGIGASRVFGARTINFNISSPPQFGEPLDTILPMATAVNGESFSVYLPYFAYAYCELTKFNMSRPPQLVNRWTQSFRWQLQSTTICCASTDTLLIPCTALRKHERNLIKCPHRCLV